MNHNDKYLFISGASTGIGRAAALAFAAEGYFVFAGVRRAQDAQALAEAGRGRVEPILVDVTDADQIRAARERIEQRVGEAGLAGLINNAGIVVAGPVEFLPQEQWERQFRVNVLGQVAVTRAFIPLLRRARGRIVNIGSISGRFGAPLMAPYASSKFALAGLSDSLRGELRPWGIRVSLIEPGPVATPIWEKSRALAERLRAEAPPEASALYGPMIEAIDKFVAGAERAAVPVDDVVPAIRHALTSPRPRARYLVGRNARLRAWLGALLPTRLVDWMIARRLGGS